MVEKAAQASLLLFFAARVVDGGLEWRAWPQIGSPLGELEPELQDCLPALKSPVAAQSHLRIATSTSLKWHLLGDGRRTSSRIWEAQTPLPLEQPRGDGCVFALRKGGKRLETLPSNHLFDSLIWISTLTEMPI